MKTVVVHGGGGVEAAALTIGVERGLQQVGAQIIKRHGSSGGSWALPVLAERGLERAQKFVEKTLDNYQDVIALEILAVISKLAGKSPHELLSGLAGGSFGGIGGTWGWIIKAIMIRRLKKRLEQAANAKGYANFTPLTDAIDAELKDYNWQVPFDVWCKDVLTTDVVSVNSGSIRSKADLKAIAASSAISILSAPIEINGRLLKDLEETSPLPFSVIEEAKQLGAECFVFVSAYPREKAISKSTFDTLSQLGNMSLEQQRRGSESKSYWDMVARQMCQQLGMKYVSVFNPESIIEVTGFNDDNIDEGIVNGESELLRAWAARNDIPALSNRT